MNKPHTEKSDRLKPELKTSESNPKLKNKIKKKVVFFDRDGTLIIDKIYLNDPDQIEYLPGAFETLKRLRTAGYEFVIVTNQSGVARGIVQIANLDEIHRRMTAAYAEHDIGFLGFYYAPYSVESNHPMRKPNAGMLLKAAEDHGLDLSKSWMVGDRISDVEAGLKAGCRTILLKGVEPQSSVDSGRQTVFVDDLKGVCDFILKHS